MRNLGVISHLGTLPSSEVEVEVASNNTVRRPPKNDQSIQVIETLSCQPPVLPRNLLSADNTPTIMQSYKTG